MGENVGWVFIDGVGWNIKLIFYGMLVSLFLK